MTAEDIREMQNESLAEAMTGCDGAGDYRDYAKEQGFNLCRTLNHSSSAGDWQFIVSRNGDEWYVMHQENNWPARGFTRTIDTSQCFYGTPDEVFAEIELMYG